LFLFPTKRNIHIKTSIGYKFFKSPAILDSSFPVYRKELWHGIIQVFLLCEMCDFDTPLWTANQCKDILVFISICMPVSSKTTFMFFLFVQHWSCHSEFFHYSICSFIYGTVDMGYFYMTFSDFCPWHTLAKVFANKYCCLVGYICHSLTYLLTHARTCVSVCPLWLIMYDLSGCPTLQHQQRKFMWAGSHEQTSITLSCGWRHN
jgi:hypothetical protein